MHFEQCSIGTLVGPVSDEMKGIVYQITWLNNASRTVDMIVVKSPMSVYNGIQHKEIDPKTLKWIPDPDSLYIGNSLSFCIKDVLAGVMPVEQVACIISSANCDDMFDVFNRNYPIYWKQYDQVEAASVFKKLWPRVIQPRTWGFEPNIAGQDRWIIANCQRQGM